MPSRIFKNPFINFLSARRQVGNNGQQGVQIVSIVAMAKVGFEEVVEVVELLQDEAGGLMHEAGICTITF